MKTRLIAGFCLGLLLIAAAAALAAPSLPVTKPAVLPLTSYTGPTNDAHALQGQWFRDLQTGGVSVRSHEWHDNTTGQGGGWLGNVAISGRVVNVVWAGPPLSSPILAFDIRGYVYNDMPADSPWLNGTNSHGEVQTASTQYTGTLWGVVLTADFALISPELHPAYQTPYRDAGTTIIATNMEMAAWYCWTPGSGYAPEGGFFVPAWHFGNIAIGGGVTRLLNFVVTPPGLQMADPRWLAVAQSYETGSDVFLNRSRSLKISNWVDDLGVDTGAAYPVPPLVSSDVSVFHNIPTNAPPAEEPTPCPKWAQAPDCQSGLDIESWGWGSGEQDFMSKVRVADDWLCDGRPVTGLRWWGSYLGWKSRDPDPTLPPPEFPLHPLAFLVMWHEDIPASPPETPFSRPGAMIEWAVYPVQPVSGQTVNGVVYEQPYCVTALDFIEPGMLEHEYMYEVQFPATNVWNEKEGKIYWLSVQAVYALPPATNAWGWKTTPPQDNWNDDAVVIDEKGMPNEMIYPPPGWLYPGHPYEGQSVNMAFELLTDVCPRRAKKWAQPPDMVTGENMASFRVQGANPLNRPLRADDWLCDGRLVSDIHWWGSYLNYRGTNSGTVKPPANAAYRPLGFDLSWHADIPAGPTSHSRPGMLLTNLFVSISNCHEVYYGTVPQYWKDPMVYEHEFQYYVDLLNPDVGLPWRETKGEVYWLNIQAVFPPEFEQSGANPDRHEGWGWKTTPLEHRWNDASVVTSNGLPWQVGIYPPKHPYDSQPCDLAFELTTHEVGGGSNWWNQPIAIRQIAKPTAAPAIISSVGDVGAGIQVLQATTNLVGSNWVDLVTNALPLPSPYTNVWTDIPALETGKFYRIKQK